jgi:ABC-type phosphate transport system auxiliary subunit
MAVVSKSMRSLDEIREAIEALTERRSELLHALNDAHDTALVAEHHKLDEELAALWDEQRAARAQLRFGERDAIIRRARTEERLERAA